MPFHSRTEKGHISFFRYPLFWVSLSLVGGFVFQHFLAFSFLLWFVVAVIFFGFQALLYRSTHFFWVFLAFWVSVGGGIHFWSLDYPMRHFSSSAGQVVSLTGYVVERDGKYFLSRIEGFPVYSPSLLLRGEKMDTFLYSRVTLRGNFRKFNSCANPGGTDQRLRWWKERVMGYLEVQEGRLTPGRSFFFLLLRWVKRSEEKFLSLWQKELRDEASLFMALFLGKKDPEFFQQRAFFERMGIYHLFCVSGFHLTLLGGMLLTVLGRFFLLKRLSFFLVIVFSFLYLLFCGLVPSAFRAFLMLSLYLVGEKLGRKILSGGVFWAAFLLMVILQPEILLDGGAQLSFASTGGLVIFMRLFEKGENGRNFVLNKMKESVLAGLAVYPVSLPFLLAHGFSFSSLFFLGNLLILPLTEVILFLSFWGVPLLFFPPLHHFLAVVLRFLLRSVSFLVQWSTTRLPYLFLDFSRSPDFFWGIWVFLGILFASLFLVFRNRAKRFWYFLVIPVFLTPFFLLPTEEFWVFDVGQGLSCGIAESGSFSFIDLGGMVRGYGLVGKSILERFLWWRGVTQIDKIFLTHWHEDHVAGLQVFALPPNSPQIFAPENPAKAEVPFLPVTSPFRFRLNQAAVWGFPVTGETVNDQALVYLVAFPGVRILVTGDIEEGGIAQLLHYGKAIEAEIVVLPHHGKYYPNLAELLFRTGCHTVIISCGENVYGHPDARVLELAQSMGLRCFITRRDGAVKIWRFLGRWRVKSFGKRDL